MTTGLDFTGTPEARRQAAHRARSSQGDGATVEKGQTIIVNYLGQVYDGETPFDESYARGEPTSFQIGAGEVIKGWDEALVGPHGRQPGAARDPAGPRLRRAGQQGRRHQGHRHAVLRRRHPRRGLTGPAGCADTADGREQASTSRKSERLLNLLIMLLVQRHYVSKERIRAILYPDSATATPSRRCSSATRRSCAASACRSRSAASTR